MTPATHKINGFSGAPVELDLSAYAGEATVYIAFHYAVNVADIWFLDDVTLVEPLEHDVRANSIIVSNHVEGGKLTLSQSVVENIGLHSESFEVEFGHFEWDGSATVLKTKSITDLPAGTRRLGLYQRFWGERLTSSQRRM